MGKKIYYADHLEKSLADFLASKDIGFVHESQNKDQILDFYLPGFGIYIEVKQYHAERVAKQLASQEEVILIQGKKALDFFINKLNG